MTDEQFAPVEPTHYIVDSSSPVPRPLLPGRDLPRLMFTRTDTGWRCTLPPMLEAFGEGATFQEAARWLMVTLLQQSRSVQEWIDQATTDEAAS